ncbi:MAG TPA: ATP synthase subunit I [Pyrinomonadaceae bacterium]|jgi:hypothetical protein|nr:ATP synthase subunit I [Pyrinomonadaceae bacterium]
MGELNEPLTTEAEVRGASRVILLIMLGIIALMAMIGLVFAGERAGIGVLVGGLLAWLNYRWLDSSTRAVLVDPITATTSILAMKYVFRYFVIGAVVFGIWWWNILPVEAVIAGLGSFAIAVVLQGLKSIFKTSL